MRSLVDLALPPSCAGCGVTAPAGVCEACCATFRPPARGHVPPGLDALYAAVAYEGAAREVVARLKYRHARRPLPLLVALLDACVPPLAGAAWAVTWIPASRARLRRAGVDHGELLARGFAACRGLPVAALLRRAPGPSQTGASPEQRRLGPALAAAPPGRPRSVVIVDDVTTTGATLRNAAATFRAQGYERVIGVVVARTPLKGARSVSESPPREIAPPVRHRSSS